MLVIFCDLTVTCPAPALQMLSLLGLFLLVYGDTLGHSVVEVKKANEIDAVIGHVAPVGVAAVGSIDSGQGNSSQIKD